MLLGSYRVGVLASETKRYLSFNILTPRRTEQQTIQDKKGVSFSKLQFSLLDIGEIDKYSENEPECLPRTGISSFAARRRRC